jgi:hypothetical protein
MNLPEEGVFLPHGGYRKLRSYKVAEAVYDAPVVFCRRFFAQDRRMSDQMVQAARSGVRNISEGSGAAATARKTEMKLTNVARASHSFEHTIAPIVHPSVLIRAAMRHRVPLLSRQTRREIVRGT